MKISFHLATVAAIAAMAVGLITCEPEKPTPSIESISPQKGPINTVVTITGKNLAATNKINFGSVSADPASRNDTKVETAVPDGVVPGMVSVNVTTDGGPSNSLQFEILPSVPEISSIDPDNGSIGMEISIKGKYLATTTHVTFGTKQVTTFGFKGETELKVNVPSELGIGAFDVTVTSPGGTSNTETFTVVPQPSISSFTPEFGPVGALVRISGANFEGVSKVIFGTGEQTTLDYKNANLVEANVPASATTGKIKVVTPGGEALSVKDFTVKAVPEVSSFDPVKGVVGTVVTINGSNFEASPVVKFGAGTATEVTLVNASKITAKVPATATTGKISVGNTVGAGESSTDFEVIGAPKVDSFSPLKGVVGTLVTINGSGFEASPVVKFGAGTATEVTLVNASKITAKVPPAATTGKISVGNATGTGQSSTDFEVLRAPTVDSFSPLKGVVGTVVTINGTGFEANPVVKFGTVTATEVTLVSALKITAKVPATATTGKISVGNATGTGQSATDFEVLVPPKVDSFSPLKGVVGTVVTINGSGFEANPVVKFGTVTATEVTFVNASKITVKVPASAATGKISVGTASGTGQSSTDFEVIGAPTVDSFSPLKGVVGTLVTINGSGFEASSVVKFGTVTATEVTFVNGSKITAKVPATATTGKISVGNAAGTGLSSTDFEVLAAPTVDSFSPLKGIVGTVVTINGSGFEASSVVKFGTVSATEVTFVNATKITAKVPATATTAKISVGNATGTGQSSTDFEVIVAPKVDSFSPLKGIVGTVVTINGSGFEASSVVKFGTVTATEVTFVNATKITAKVPATATTGKISVANAAGTGQSSTDFEVIGVPTVDSFSPLKGNIGATVVINGKFFVNVSEVKFNTTVVAAANYTVDSDIKITAKVPAGAFSGKISVTTPAGTGQSANSFTVELPPQVNSFDPGNGLPNSTVVITGLNFTGITSVTINNIEVGVGNFTVDSPTQISARVPANGTSGKIKVTNGSGSSTSAGTFYVTPVIASINPTSASAGSPITITGTNMENAKVMFNSTEVTPTSNSANTIVVNSPVTTGAKNVTVVNLGGTSNARTFTATAPVVVDEVVAGANIANQLILFTGSNLLGATKVWFNSTQTNVLTVTDKVVSATIPSLPLGSYQVRVETNKGTSVAKTFQVLSTQTVSNTGGATLTTGSTISAYSAPVAPPVANFWENFNNSNQSLFVKEVVDNDFQVEFNNGVDVYFGNGFFNNDLVGGAYNNYIEFYYELTPGGTKVRYVGTWTPYTAVDDGSGLGTTKCMANLTAIETVTGKQLKLIVDFGTDCP